MLQSSNKYSATAAILTEFIPALDTLRSLRESFRDDAFGQMYNALPGAIQTGFTSMGCTEYDVPMNDPIVSSRMIVVHTEPSLTVPLHAVIRTVVPGMELQGNMIRLAQVVTSLGPEGNMPEATEVPSSTVPLSPDA
jgi:molecular chaperone GrpE (heat shock protein)